MPNPQDCRRWYAWPLLALGATGFAAAWMLIAVASDRQCAWMAPIAALDLVMLMKAAHWPAGRGRSAWATLATALVIVAANFLIVAGQVGKGLGLRPLESALKIGAEYAWLLQTMTTDRTDLALYAASLLLAAWLGFSGRRPAPSTR